MRMILPALLVVLACATPPVMRSLPPALRLGRIIHDPLAKPPSEETKAAVMARLQALITMVYKRDWKDLPSMVSTRKGLYVDLKGFRSHAQITNDVKDTGSYIYTFYHDTEKLRAATRDAGQICVRDVLLMSSTITVDLFMEEGDAEVELQLNVDDAPRESYRLNHAVFILEDGQWKVFRLF